VPDCLPFNICIAITPTHLHTSQLRPHTQTHIHTQTNRKCNAHVLRFVAHWVCGCLAVAITHTFVGKLQTHTLKATRAFTNIIGLAPGIRNCTTVLLDTSCVINCNASTQPVRNTTSLTRCVRVCVCVSECCVCVLMCERVGVSEKGVSHQACGTAAVLGPTCLRRNYTNKHTHTHKDTMYINAPGKWNCGSVT